MRISRNFTSQQYFSEEDVGRDTPDLTVKTNLTLDSDERRIDIKTQEHSTPKDRSVSFGANIVLSKWSDIQEVTTLLQRFIREQDDSTRSITLPVVSELVYNSRLNKHNTDIEDAIFSVDEFGLDIDAEGLCGRLPHCTYSVGNTPQNRRNAMTFLNMVGELFEDLEGEPALQLQDFELWSSALPEYIDGHYQSSVRTAFRVLEERIRKIGNFPQEMTGSTLAKEAFKPSGGPLSFAEVKTDRRRQRRRQARSACRDPPSRGHGGGRRSRFEAPSQTHRSYRGRRRCSSSHDRTRGTDQSAHQRRNCPAIPVESSPRPPVRRARADRVRLRARDDRRR